MNVVEQRRLRDDEALHRALERNLCHHALARTQRGAPGGDLVIHVDRGCRRIGFERGGDAPGHERRAGGAQARDRCWLRGVDPVGVAGKHRNAHPQRIHLGDLQEGSGGGDRLTRGDRHRLHDTVERRGDDDLTLRANRSLLHRAEALASRVQGRLGDLQLSARFLDAPHAGGSLLEQLFEALDAASCRLRLGLRGIDGAPHLDALVAFGRCQGRQRHQAGATRHAGAGLDSGHHRDGAGHRRRDR